MVENLKGFLEVVALSDDLFEASETEGDNCPLASVVADRAAGVPVSTPLPPALQLISASGLEGRSQLWPWSHLGSGDKATERECSSANPLSVPLGSPVPGGPGSQTGSREMGCEVERTSASRDL